MVTALDKYTALVLIDLQNGILEMPMADPIATVLANAAKLVAAFRKAALPIVIVNVNPSLNKRPATRKDGGNMPNTIFKENWLHIAAPIKTEPTDIFITKHTWAAFFETSLQEALQKRNITGIVLAGVATSIGVEGTARQAAELGYNIAFAKDAMSDRFVDAQANSLKYIFPRLGEIDDTDNIIALLP